MRGAAVRFALSLVLVLGVAVLSAQRAEARQAEGSVAQKQRLMRIRYNGEMAPLLAALAEEYEVTIGLEFESAQTSYTVKVEMADPTLHDLLEVITQAAPKYKWRETKGAIEVYPMNGGSGVLDTPLNRLNVRDADWAGASDALLGLPEMQAGLLAVGLNRRGAAVATKGQGGARFSLELEGVTARAALHEMTKKSGGHFWMFRPSVNTGEYLLLRNSVR